MQGGANIEKDQCKVTQLQNMVATKLHIYLKLSL